MALKVRNAEARVARDANRFFIDGYVQISRLLSRFIEYDSAMDLNKMLAELRAERDQIEEAIIALGRLSLGTKRRGRPPLWMNQIKGVEGAGPKRRGGAPRAKKKTHHTEDSWLERPAQGLVC